MELLKRIFGLIRIKRLEGRDLKTLEHKSKWYIKNGWQTKKPPHLYHGWTGLRAGRFRVILCKEREFTFREWCSNLVFRMYKRLGLDSMTVKHPQLYHRGDWILMHTLGETSSTRQGKVIFIRDDQIVYCPEEGISKIVWFHLAASLGVGLLASLMLYLPVATLLPLEGVNYHNWIGGLAAGTAGIFVAHWIHNKIEVE